MPPSKVALLANISRPPPAPCPVTSDISKSAVINCPHFTLRFEKKPSERANMEIKVRTQEQSCRRARLSARKKAPIYDDRRGGRRVNKYTKIAEKQYIKVGHKDVG